MRPKLVIETHRAFLRELTVNDAEDFYQLNLDPDVIKYTGDKSFENIEDSKTFLQHYDQYKKFGVGRLAVIEKETNSFIGWCGLKYSPDKNEYDIGFRFYKTYWNRGFATETAKKCLEFGFENLNLEKIVGRAIKENSGSIKVLEKIGMTFIKSILFDGKEGVLYEIKNDAKI